MRISTNCYYLYDNKFGNEALDYGFNWLKQQSADTGGLIAVHSFTHLLNYSNIKGLSNIDLIRKPPHRAIIDGITFDIILPSSIIRHGINRPMLVIHPTREFWNKLNHIRDLSEIFVMSNTDVIGKWKKERKINRAGVIRPLSDVIID